MGLRGNRFLCLFLESVLPDQLARRPWSWGEFGKYWRSFNPHRRLRGWLFPGRVYPRPRGGGQGPAPVFIIPQSRCSAVTAPTDSVHHHKVSGFQLQAGPRALAADLRCEITWGPCWWVCEAKLGSALD